MKTKKYYIYLALYQLYLIDRYRKMLVQIFILIIIVCFMLGIVCVTINLVKLNYPEPETKIVYRFIPKSFAEQQNDLPMASDVFKSMFTEQTPWVNSIMDYDRRKETKINQYFISQI